MHSPFTTDGGVDDILNTVRHRGPTLDEVIDRFEAEHVPHAVRCEQYIASVPRELARVGRWNCMNAYMLACTHACIHT